MECSESQTDQPIAQSGEPHGEASQCLVVMYHYVRPGPIGPNDGIRGLTVEAFTEQLACLCRRLEPICFSQFCAWQNGTATIPPRSFMVTFDDGLIDHYLTVVPTLESFGINGTFFVPGLVLDSLTMLPAHRIHLLLSALGTEGFVAEAAEVLPTLDPTIEFPPPGCSESERMYGYEKPALARLKYALTMVMPVDVRDEMLKTLFAKHVGADDEWSRRWYMSWNNLVAMQAQGHTIGGHGFSHEPFTRMSARQRSADINRSRSILEAGLGKSHRPFSYPFGCHDNDTASLCARAGFAFAFTTKSEWCHHNVNRFSLPRVDTIHVGARLTELHPCH